LEWVPFLFYKSTRSVLTGFITAEFEFKLLDLIMPYWNFGKIPDCKNRVVLFMVQIWMSCGGGGGGGGGRGVICNYMSKP
jgi:hypothetical protein